MATRRKRSGDPPDRTRAVQLALETGGVEAAVAALAEARKTAQLAPVVAPVPAQPPAVVKPLTPKQEAAARRKAEREAARRQADQAKRDALLMARFVIGILHDSRQLLWSRNVPLLARTVDSQPWEATTGRMLAAQFRADPMLTVDWTAAVIVRAVARKRGPLKLYKATFEELVTRARAEPVGTRVELLDKRRSGVIEVWVGGSRWRDLADLDTLDDPDLDPGDDPDLDGPDDDTDDDTLAEGLWDDDDDS